jgi:uncharacterized RDD family membrane protein YckC
MFGSKREEFALTPDEEPFEFGESRETADWRVERRIEPGRQSAPAMPSSLMGVQWAGFFRRALAFAVDLVMIVFLLLIMSSLAYIGYKVGLSAHSRSVTLQNSTPLFFFLLWASAGLSIFYFALFHGMEGKTIGKWLLGVRVVRAERQAVTYKQAFLRAFAIIVSLAPLGLGFLWIIWSPAKRSWHDCLAGTWVIRDS